MYSRALISSWDTSYPLRHISILVMVINIPTNKMWLVLMQYIIKVVFLIFLAYSSFAQLTPFEKSNGKETATYFEVVEFYKNLDKASTKISMKEVGPTDAGYPLNIVLLSNDGNFDLATWHKT
ncbi:MAG: hypothetical protein ABIQ56_00865, partial [Chitinophagaceae bacterium]